mmetsp:Transcript_6915/g.20013  ORF Transcript_6915/g.20013 Transcript_6915/m.20013 type:complete len:411 (+) Transcript_6915:172-1404(+)
MRNDYELQPQSHCWNSVPDDIRRRGIFKRKKFPLLLLLDGRNPVPLDNNTNIFQGRQCIPEEVDEHRSQKHIDAVMKAFVYFYEIIQGHGHPYRRCEERLSDDTGDQTRNGGRDRRVTGNNEIVAAPIDLWNQSDLEPRNPVVRRRRKVAKETAGILAGQNGDEEAKGSDGACRRQCQDTSHRHGPQVPLHGGPLQLDGHQRKRESRHEDRLDVDHVSHPDHVSFRDGQEIVEQISERNLSIVLERSGECVEILTRLVRCRNDPDEEIFGQQNRNQQKHRKDSLELTRHFVFLGFGSVVLFFVCVRIIIVVIVIVVVVVVAVAAVAFCFFRHRVLLDGSGRQSEYNHGSSCHGITDEDWKLAGKYCRRDQERNVSLVRKILGRPARDSQTGCQSQNHGKRDNNGRQDDRD